MKKRVRRRENRNAGFLFVAFLGGLFVSGVRDLIGPV